MFCLLSVSLLWDKCTLNYDFLRISNIYLRTVPMQFLCIGGKKKNLFLSSEVESVAKLELSLIPMRLVFSQPLSLRINDNTKIHKQ